ncbi:hypothetical protein ACQR2U_14215 [Clostridium perfringens]
MKSACNTHHINLYNESYHKSINGYFDSKIGVRIEFKDYIYGRN